MVLSGYRIDGDPDGLRYLRANESAVPQLVDRVRRAGRATFTYLERHFVVLPATSGSFIVSEAHQRRPSGPIAGLRSKAFL